MLHHCWKKCRAFLHRFHVHQQGAAALFIGLGIFTLITATGVAVDMSRMQMVRAKLSSSLDAAGLAAGAKAHSANIQDVMNNYMRVNFPTGYMDSTLIDSRASANPDNTVITLQATARVDMTFMKVLGFDYQDITVNSEITRENRGLELVMVLDTTGSMAGSKIADLRSAATSLTNILFGSKETIQNLWVGIVSYGTAVNIGNTHSAWVRDYDLSRYPNKYPSSATKWKGCVEARNQWPDQSATDTDGIPLDVSDAPPYTGNRATATAGQLNTMFPMYFWADNTDNDWIANNGNVSLNESAGYSDGGAKGPNVGCGEPILPFTSSKSTVLNHISSLDFWRRGGTMSSTGMAWGWRLISPRWRSYWNHETADLPLDYGTPLMNKAVIVMTDGVNEVFSPTSNPPGGSDYTSYRRIAEQRFGNGVNTKSEGITAVNNRFTQLCTNMKAKGILIYTITFQLGNSTAHNNARTLFRSCATHPDFYFDSPDGAALQTAFKTIGDSLANLMISK